MTEKIINTKIQVLAYTELSDDDKKIVDLAKDATHRSYAPYSHFHVGAALLLQNGSTVLGANQENAAFAGICAERSACYNAGANYPGVPIAKIAIAAYQNGNYVKEPCSPCGVCRQALMEFEVQAHKPIEVLLVGRDMVYRLIGIKSLLPLGFEAF